MFTYQKLAARGLVSYTVDDLAKIGAPLTIPEIIEYAISIINNTTEPFYKSIKRFSSFISKQNLDRTKFDRLIEDLPYQYRNTVRAVYPKLELADLESFDLQAPDYQSAMNFLSCNPALTPAWTRQYPSWKWDFDLICANSHFTLNDLDQFSRSLSRHEICYGLNICLLMKNPSIDFYELDISTDNRYYVEMLITWMDVNPKSDITRFFTTPHLHSRIQDSPSFQIQNHRDLTWDIIQAHPEINWNYDILSKHPKITIDNVTNNPNKQWSYDLLAGNSSISLQDLEQHESKFKDRKSVSCNPNLTADFIAKHPDWAWDPELLKRNNFEFDHRSSGYKAARKLQNWIRMLRARYFNPLQRPRSRIRKQLLISIRGLPGRGIDFITDMQKQFPDLTEYQIKELYHNRK